MIYDYKCDSCGRDEKDVWQRMNDPPPDCCGHQMSRFIGVPAQVNAFFFGSTKNPGYHCVVSDRWIDTKRKRLSVMDEFGVSPKEAPTKFPAQTR